MQPAVPFKRPRDADEESDSSGSSLSDTTDSGSDDEASSSDPDSTSSSDDDAMPPTAGGGGGPNHPEIVEEYKKASTDALPAQVAALNGNPRFFQELMKLDATEHKGLHYLKESISLFLDSVAADYNKQKKSAISSNKEIKPFRWSNTGQVAENFAVACDQVKKIHMVLEQKNGGKGVKSHGQNQQNEAPMKASVKVVPFDRFITTFLQYLSGVSEVASKTFDVKIKDWIKGGTRYEADDENAQVKGNVKFSGVLQRQKKLDLWMQKKELLPVGSKIVNAAKGTSVPVSTATTTVRPPPSRTAPVHLGGGGGGATSPQPGAGGSGGGMPVPDTFAAISEEARKRKESTFRRRIQDATVDGRFVLKITPLTPGKPVGPADLVELGQAMQPQVEVFVNLCRLASNLSSNVKSRQYLLDALERCTFVGAELNAGMTARMVIFVHFMFEKYGGFGEVSKWLEQSPEEKRYGFLSTMCRLRISKFSEQTKKLMAKAIDDEDESATKDLTWLISGEGSKSTATLVRILETRMGVGSAAEFADTTVTQRVEHLNKRAWAKYCKDHLSTSPWATNRGAVPPYNPFDYLTPEDQLADVPLTDTDTDLWIEDSATGAREPKHFQYPSDVEVPPSQVDQAWNPNRSDLLFAPPLLTTPIPVKPVGKGGNVPAGRHAEKPDTFSFDDWVNYLTEEHELKKAGKL